MTRILSMLAITMIAAITITGCTQKADPLAGLPDATATAEQLTGNPSYYHFKTVAVTGTVERVAQGVVYLTGGVECYMQGDRLPAAGQTVTIQGKCMPGDRGVTIDGASLKG